MAARKDAEHPVVRGLKWILENRTQPSGRRWSMRALSTAAGLTPSHVEGIINGRQSPNIELKTAVALARAGNVKVHWLQRGEGPREPYDGDDADVTPPPSPLPPSARRITPGSVSPSELAELLDQAYVGERHAPSDALAVEQGVASGRLRLPTTGEGVSLVRVWLDAAARLRGRGTQATPDNLVIEVTRRVVDLESRRAPPSQPDPQRAVG